jgi:hypothetical protein
MAAPENQFAAVRQLWSAPGMGRQKEMDEWVATYSRLYNDNVQAQTHAFINESNSAFQARQASYRAAAEVQAQQNDEFRANLKAGTNASMAHAAEIANSNHRSAQDMVDYSLDRQTVIFPQTGAVVKLPNDVTATGAQKAHADGTPW